MEYLALKSNGVYLKKNADQNKVKALLDRILFTEVDGDSPVICVKDNFISIKAEGLVSDTNNLVDDLCALGEYLEDNSSIGISRERWETNIQLQNNSEPTIQ